MTPYHIGMLIGIVCGLCIGIGFTMALMRRPTIEELENILNGPAPDVRIEPDGTVTQGFANNGSAE